MADPWAPPPNTPAAVVEDSGPRYQRIALLGEGGMGAVWLGVDRRLGRRVAIKVPGPDPHRTALLEREARLAAKLDHPGIVTVFDVADIEGWPCFVMAWVPGTSLARRLDEGEIATWEPARCASLVAEAAAAIGHAHRRGIVHHDLSPSNLLCTDDGHVRVIDWGLARDLNDTAGDAGPGGGTPGWRAPEVERREPATPASDVWSLGTVLATLLAPPVDDGLAAIIARATSSEPSARYADAWELHEALTTWGLDHVVRPITTERRRPWRRATVVLAAVVSAVTVWLLASSTPEDRPTPGTAAIDPENAQRSDGTAPFDATSIIEMAESALRAYDAAAVAARVVEAFARAPGPRTRALAFALLHEPALAPAVEALPAACGVAVPDPWRAGRFACFTERRIALVEDGLERWSVEQEVRDVRFLEDALLVIDNFRHTIRLDRSNGEVRQTDPRQALFLPGTSGLRLAMARDVLYAPPTVTDFGASIPVPCEEGAISAAEGPGSLLVTCVEGGAWWWTPEGAVRAHGVEDTFEVAAVLPGERPIALGGTRGGAVVRLGGRGARLDLGEPIASIHALGDQGHAVAATTRGRILRIDARTLEIRAALRADGFVSLATDGGTGLVATTRDAALRWTLTASIETRRMEGSHGLAALTWTGNGQMVVALDGVGRVVALRPDDGTPVAPVRWGTGVGKSIIAVGNEGDLWMVGMGGGGLIPLRADLDRIEVGEVVPHPGEFRQVVASADGELVATPFGGGTLRTGPDGRERERRKVFEGREGAREGMTDIMRYTRSRDGAHALWLTDAGAWRALSNGPPERWHEGTAWTAGAVDDAGYIVAAEAETVTWLRPDGSTAAMQHVESPTLSAVALPDEAGFATGHLDGSMSFWSREGELLLAWRPHRDRVADLALSPDGLRLASASWDGAIVVTPLSPYLRWVASGRDDADVLASLRTHAVEAGWLPRQAATSAGSSMDEAQVQYPSQQLRLQHTSSN